MSAQTASTEGSRPGTTRPEAPGALRVLAMAAVCVGLAALAGGTFVLSYSGIHALALHAGIAPRLARGYPLLLDAMLVIVLAAVLALRGADLPSRLLAWTTLVAVLAAAAGADALHAAGRRLPGHVGAITAAVLPWALVFLAFALLLAMLRHARLRRLGATRTVAARGEPVARSRDSQHGDAPLAATRPAAIVPGIDPPGWQPELAAALLEAEQPELAMDAELRPDDPTSDEAAPEAASGTDQEEAGQADLAGGPSGQPGEAAEHGEKGDPEMPVFHRMWSPPTPPEPQA